MSNMENAVAEDVSLETIPESFGGHSDVAPWALFGAYQIAKDIMMINEKIDFPNSCLIFRLRCF